MAAVSRAIYDGMAQVDSAAVWLQMGWTFNLSRQKDWTDDRLAAMINAVPHGRMVLIDYVCEENELFRDTKGFYGAPFIWDYLGNFGGNTHLVGPINKINQRLTAVMNDSTLTNCIGVGAPWKDSTIRLFTRCCLTACGQARISISPPGCVMKPGRAQAARIRMSKRRGIFSGKMSLWITQGPSRGTGTFSK